MSDLSAAPTNGRDLIACPACGEFVSIRSAGVGEAGSRTFTCAFCNHRFAETDAPTLEER